MKNWPQIRRILRIVGTLVGLAIFAYQLYTSIGALSAQKQQLQLIWGWMFLAMAVYLLVYLLQMLNLWLVYKVKFPALPFKPILQGYSMSFLPKYTPGYIWGYLSRADWLESRAGIPGAYSWLATVLEVVVTLMSGAVVLLLNWSLRGGRYLSLALLAALLPWLVWLLMRLAARFTRKYLQEERRHVVEAFTIPFPRWALISVNSIFQWLLLGIGLRLISAGFSTPTALPFWSALWKHIYAFCLSWLGGFLAVLIPNGLGVRETVLNALLESQAGFAASAAVVISVASRVLLFLAELGWLLLALLIKQNPPVDQKYS
ncbi:MAG: lysylphosphatidylglycerol synthase domain-containing protein [Anaerolineaceae bacterium]